MASHVGWSISFFFSISYGNILKKYQGGDGPLSIWYQKVPQY